MSAGTFTVYDVADGKIRQHVTCDATVAATCLRDGQGIVDGAIDGGKFRIVDGAPTAIEGGEFEG